MSKKKVLVTGATGYIASQFRETLCERYDATLIDVKTTTRQGDEVPGVIIADLLNEDWDSLLPFFAGVDTVVHCAYIRPPKDESDPRKVYPIERSNVDLMHMVFQLSLEAGVKRVVAMSTNQAALWYEEPYFQGLKDRVSPEEYPKPVNFYGWAKAAYESLGFVYACGSLGRKLENIHLRIVVPRDVNPGGARKLVRHRYIRNLAGYISPRDLTQLVVKSIDTPNIDDEYGVPFHIFYAVSNNARTFWSITNARKVVGYEPEDDSEKRFAKDIARILYDDASDDAEVST